jgi:hypothetical protein
MINKLVKKVFYENNSTEPYLLACGPAGFTCYFFPSRC